VSYDRETPDETVQDRARMRSSPGKITRTERIQRKPADRGALPSADHPVSAPAPRPAAPPASGDPFGIHLLDNQDDATHPPPGDLGGTTPGPDNPQAKIEEAEDFNRHRISAVVKFDRATRGTYAKRNGELDAEGVMAWQTAHAVAVDGKVNDETIAEVQKHPFPTPKAQHVKPTPGPHPGPGPAPAPEPGIDHMPLDHEGEECFELASTEDSGYEKTFGITEDRFVRALIVDALESWEKHDSTRARIRACWQRFVGGRFENHPKVVTMRNWSFQSDRSRPVCGFGASEREGDGKTHFFSLNGASRSADAMFMQYQLAKAHLLLS
jgi:hypothetical protein